MIVLMHILIAISSVAVATIVFRAPTIKKLLVSYGFILATIASGTYLLIETPGAMLKACISGLLYVTVVTIVTIASHVRLRSRARVI